MLRQHGLVVVIDGVNEAGGPGGDDDDLEGVNPLVANPLVALVKQMMPRLPVRVWVGYRT